MDREIFNQNLPVATTSAYLLICAVVDGGARPGLELLRSRWAASPEELDQALAELTGLNIITRKALPADEDPVYQPNPAFKWGPAPPWPAPKGLPVFDK
ncbi:MAG: hypothetical protein LBP33_04540 [Candidatus Adiutrix sp.]|jgi:hypothetical protein|nr:hypothetical protein [Candidatus Adiutrix sp.]